MVVLQTQDKTLHLVDNFWHVLTKEPGFEKIQADCIAWVNERLPGRVDNGSGAVLAGGPWEKVEKQELPDALLN